MVGTFYVISRRIDQPDFLSTVQLRVLVAAGNEIGDHTMDHANLTALGDSDLKSQIDEGASRIAQATGRWPESLAYPSGYQDGRVWAASPRARGCASPFWRLACTWKHPARCQRPRGIRVT